MAGVKVTDLPSLAAADPTDIMYIVDAVSNQSRKIEVQNLVGGLPDIDSGSWNPTPTNVFGSPSVTIISGNYSRVGSVVTCSLFLDVTMGTAENQCTFDLDLPIASDFAQAKNAFGIIAYQNVGDGELVNWGIAADTATDKINMSLQSVTNEFSYQYLYAVLQYVII
jgi:hypothetical protein